MDERVEQIYKNLADGNNSFAQKNGRYPVQELAERLICKDLLQKMDLKPTDSLLEIGCGVGSLLLPLSFFVENVVGVDIEDSIKVLESRMQSENIQTIAGLFPDVEIEGAFDKVLIYCILMYLPTLEKFYEFLDSALELMKPDGCMLLGDITTTGRKKRFLDSERGKRFSVEWNAIPAELKQAPKAPEGAEFLEFTDEVVMNILLHARKKGYHSYLLDQPADLPFGNTREDIMIYGPEYERS